MNIYIYKYIFGESFNLQRLLLMIAFYHQTKISISFDVGDDQTSDLLFNHQRFYQLSQLEPTNMNILEDFFDYMNILEEKCLKLSWYALDWWEQM